MIGRRVSKGTSGKRSANVRPTICRKPTAELRVKLHSCTRPQDMHGGTGISKSTCQSSLHLVTVTKRPHH